MPPALLDVYLFAMKEAFLNSQPLEALIQVCTRTTSDEREIDQLVQTIGYKNNCEHQGPRSPLTVHRRYDTDVLHECLLIPNSFNNIKTLTYYSYDTSSQIHRTYCGHLKQFHGSRFIFNGHI